MSYQAGDEEEKKNLIRQLRQITIDYKVGVIAAELVENNVSADTIFFRNQSSFKRSVAKDISAVYWNNAEDAPSNLVFELNREGIYDMLPEALSHSQTKKSKTESNTKRSQELRKQEKDARNFFSPLENEFHHRALKLDTIERELLKSNNHRRNRQFFSYFFEESSMLTDQQVLVLMHILPLSHKIRGDEQLIALTTTRILGYKVSVSNHWIRKKFVMPKGADLNLGERMLGINSILNEQFEISARYYEVTIHQIPVQEHHHFIGKGKHLNVLSFILPYFFPSNADFGILLEAKKEEQHLLSSDEENFSFLGFNSYI
ncbi:MAG: hypothetical protein ABI378_04190 [Chitinophagaceae bacterium]